MVLSERLGQWYVTACWYRLHHLCIVVGRQTSSKGTFGIHCWLRAALLVQSERAGRGGAVMDV